MTDNQEELEEPLDKAAAKKLAKEILDTGNVEWWDHALKRLAERNMTTLDFENIVKGGWVDQIEQVNEGRSYGCWRYRFTTREMSAIVQFTSRREMVAVSAWRL